MDRTAEGMTQDESAREASTSPDVARPRDLALLLLAIGAGPPRARARDQEADRTGGELRRQVLDRLVALDPDPSGVEAALEVIVAEMGEPTGPARAVACSVLEEWGQTLAWPASWDWLLSEALERTQGLDPSAPMSASGARRRRGAP
jgi:hypothetical protein